MRAFVLTLSALAALAIAGCGKNPAAPAPAGGSAAPPSDKQAPSAAATPTKADKTGKAYKTGKLASAGGAQPKAGEPTTEAPKPPSPKAPTGPVAGDRTKMGEAFVEIYCAQQAGEADKLLAIYKRYGFQNPKAWTKAWTEAAKDEAWIARITERAIAKCPPKQ